MIISHKLTTTVHSYFLEYSQYPINNTYNIIPGQGLFELKGPH